MGPGPSDVAPSVLKAMSAPLLGHLDPVFVKMMDEIKVMLREVFLTKNEMTFPVSGTGSAGMEFCCANLIEPGDEVIIGVNGVFGTRMCDVAERCGAKVIKVEAPWGQIIEPKQIAEALRHHRPKFVAIVHAETSTGALTPVEEISKMAHDRGALMLLDTVTSLGGCPVRLDDWGIDAVYSGTQKCLSCPPGLSPVSLSPRALEVATKRKTKVQSWYLDVNLLASYWGEQRVYHHTAPISMNYALHEALRLVLEEGLENRWRAPRTKPSRAQGRPEGTRPQHRLAGRPSTLAAQRRDRARGRGRSRRAQATAHRLQHRDRRRPRPDEGQDLAHRPDGRHLHARECEEGARGAEDLFEEVSSRSRQMADSRKEIGTLSLSPICKLPTATRPYAAAASTGVALTALLKSDSAPSFDALTYTRYVWPGVSASVTKSGAGELPTGIGSGSSTGRWR